MPWQVRTDSESYLISVYRCPTRLPRRQEGQRGEPEQEEEEEGEQEQFPGEGQPFYPSEGFDAPPGMFGGPGLRRKKLSFNQNEKRKWKEDFRHNGQLHWRGS